MDVQKILSLKRYFKILQTSNSSIKFSLTTASVLIKQNIYYRWLESISSKADKNFQVHLGDRNEDASKTLPVGFITPKMITPDFNANEYDLANSEVLKKTNLIFKLLVPQNEKMQYFFQWQRYRKYWWSMITTTPSLFSIDDIKYLDESAKVDIVAKLQDGKQPVENVSIAKSDKDNTAVLSCVTNLEEALFTSLLDGTLNSTKEGYLRLHRTIAPYKFSFALDYEDPNARENLIELASLLNSRLHSRSISTTLPDFSINLQEQVMENLKIGVVYTIILKEETLNNGIFYLLNSSTMLKEQVHVASFDSYASLISGSNNRQVL